MRSSIFLVFAFGAAVVLANHPEVLSDKDHFKVRSFFSFFFSTYHFKGKEHDAKFDHEAFLGKDTAAEYDQLTPEKSKERLA